MQFMQICKSEKLVKEISKELIFFSYLEFIKHELF